MKIHKNSNTFLAKIPLKEVLGPGTAYLGLCFVIFELLGTEGLFGGVFDEFTLLKFSIYAVVAIHVTITSMSLSFHRYHTHKGVILHPFIDALMQINLWLVGGMSKLDWCSVHIYHHAYSDKKEDPHSPVQKGLLHILFLGVLDYTKAKNQAPILKIRKTLKRSRLEGFIARHTLMGVILLTALNLILFGPMYGSILSVINFSISPIFAVGGVNGLAHWFGYKNHNFHDNSRNLGFLFPLNFLICGELDHNNHHAHPRSCSFRHKWYEFDWGFFYIKILSSLRLAEIKNAYTPRTLKSELSDKIVNIIEMDLRFKKRVEEIAKDLNTSYQEVLAAIQKYIQGNKIKLSRELKLLIKEAKRTFYINYQLKLNY